jgi:hypothetical protein
MTDLENSCKKVSVRNTHFPLLLLFCSIGQVFGAPLTRDSGTKSKALQFLMDNQNMAVVGEFVEEGKKQL